MEVAVVGAGVIGLSTALNIIQQIPEVKVTIIADKFEKETTSYGASGFFRPNTTHAPGIPVHLIKRWSEKSWQHFSSMARSNMSAESGCCITSGYIFSHVQPDKMIYEDIVYNVRKLSDVELTQMGMERFKFGFAVTNIITNMQRYLPWLMKRFKEYGGQVIRRKIDSLEELTGNYNLVVNCAALGNREWGDKSVYPVRGQIVKVEAPWIKHWFFIEGTYMIPNADCVSLGCVRKKDSFNLNVDSTDTAEILQRCYELWPALKGARIISEWVGLRPTRSPVRLEKEVMTFPNGELKVVHNYGHGSNGITFSWGTGLEATEMVREMLRQQPQAKL